MKEEQTPAGTTQAELKHYCDLFKAKKNGVIPKRILVQGQTGIGKSTFVKKLLVDWVDVNNETGDEQAAILKNFELVVAINLKEVSKCQSLKDVIRLSKVFAKEDKYMTEGLADYITNNQEKVLLIFDGYDEYRSGRDSEIYEIFSGNSLRSCCVLMTTRISKADELQGGEDLQAEITGFSEVDRKDFMHRFLSIDEASDLEMFLFNRNLEELAKVPLLLLFFCILWRRRKLKLFPETKTSLYKEIVQFILNHSYSKQTPPLYVQLTSLEKILSEIGKVALQALLKDDHLFEYSQLSDSVRCDESVLIGLLQITEYSETLQPIGMVSFIHKSIQEFLAAWYITYRCIPEGGNLGEIGGKLEECLALENVFQFVCGLSEVGASTALTHLKSVRISDPSLDMSKAIPDFENETDAPLSDVTECQCKFRDLVVNSCKEVESKAELSRACLDCLGSILISPGFESLPKDLLLKAQHENSWSVVFELNYKDLRLMKYEVLALQKTLESLVTESSEILKVTNFVRKFYDIYFFARCFCGFLPVVCFRNDQVHFYTTHLDLVCDDHAQLFIDFAVPSNSEHLSSGQLCLKFMKTLHCSPSIFSMECLGAVIKHCNHLERLQILNSDDTLCHILEQVTNPLKCSLSIRHCAVTSNGAQKLALLLPRFENVTEFELCLVNCSHEAVEYINHKSLFKMVLTLSALQTLSTSSLADDEFCDGTATSLFAAIKHKTLTELTLSEILLTSPVAEALGYSLPKLSALQTLRISGWLQCSDLAITSLVGAIRHNTLERLKLCRMNLTSAAAKALSQSLPELLALRSLKIGDLAECSDDSVTRLVAALAHKSLEIVKLCKMNLTSAAAEALGHSLPKLSALQTLRISGWLQCSDLAITSLVGAIRHNTLERLKLCRMNLTSAAAKALSQSLPELLALRSLKIGDLAECSDDSVTRLVAALAHKSLAKVKLRKMNLTSAAAEALGRSLPELPALEEVRVSGSDGCSLQHEVMEAMFGKFKRPSRLIRLKICNFSSRGTLSQVTRNLCFFPSLLHLELEALDMGEADLCGLLENLKFIPDLRTLSLMGNPLGKAVRLMVPYLLNKHHYLYLQFGQGDCSEEDLNYVREAIKGKSNIELANKANMSPFSLPRNWYGRPRYDILKLVAELKIGEQQQR